MEIELEIGRKQNIISLFGGGWIMFNQMDKFQCWVASRNVTWAHIIGFSSLMTFKLTPIRHLVKEFLQSIVWLNIDTIEFVVPGITVIKTENHVMEMLCLP
jgi:hypothetical protein